MPDPSIKALTLSQFKKYKPISALNHQFLPAVDGQCFHWAFVVFMAPTKSLTFYFLTRLSCDNIVWRPGTEEDSLWGLLPCTSGQRHNKAHWNYNANLSRGSCLESVFWGIGNALNSPCNCEPLFQSFCEKLLALLWGENFLWVVKLIAFKE